MIEQQGYLTSVTNPNFSGLASVTFRDTLEPTPETRVTRCYCESGFGVRQLVDALGVGGRLVQASARTLVTFVIDDRGLLASIQT